jgi:hypothetical protein
VDSAGGDGDDLAADRQEHEAVVALMDMEILSRREPQPVK